jgi:hypothetical protein
VVEMGGLSSTHGEIRNGYRSFIEKPEENRQLGCLEVDGSIILK